MFESIADIRSGMGETPGLGAESLGTARSLRSSRYPEVLILRKSYNAYKDQYVKIPVPDFIGVDVDGVLANGIDFQELSSQVFLSRYGYLYPVALLRQVKDEGIDLWRFGIERAKRAEKKEFVDYQEELREIERNALGELRDTLVVEASSLEFLKARFPVVILTNRSQEDLDSFVSKAGISTRISGAFGQVRERKNKPKPDVLLRACEQNSEMQRAVARATAEGRKLRGIMIGDSRTDLALFEHNVARVGIELYPIGILPPGHGYNQRLEDTLFREQGACHARAVYPSANHFFKDICANYDKDEYLLLRGTLSDFVPYRESAAPYESEEYLSLFERVKEGIDKRAGVQIEEGKAYRVFGLIPGQSGIDVLSRVKPIDFECELKRIRRSRDGRK